jgi:hypothetical protein
MHMYGGREGVAPQLFTSTLGGGNSSDSGSGRFTAVKTVLVTHWTGSWVGPRDGVDDLSTARTRTPAPRPPSQELHRLLHADFMP